MSPAGPAPVSAAALAAAFTARFAATPRVFAAPGRVNLIGEHTDYSGGFAMPAAIDRRCLVAVASAPSRRTLRIRSQTLGQEAERPLADLKPTGDWSDYVVGAAAMLQKQGATLAGADLMVDSDVPQGAGVSSSAALGVASVLAMAASAGLTLSPPQVFRLAWQSETEFVGAPCGPLDQFAATFGKAGEALLLDCRSLTATPVPLPNKAALVLIDSGVKHAVRDGGYAARRADCEEAARLLKVDQLRDATAAQIDAADLPERLARRARYVVGENARVRQGAAHLQAGDLSAFGALMNASHAGLRDDFDATCPETDRLAALAQATPGVYGARQMGGGFGGCVLALTDEAQAPDAAAAVAAAYAEGTPWFLCRTADGAKEVRL